MKRWFILLLLTLLTGAVIAQETTPEPEPESTEDAASIAEQCPALVENALRLTQVNCGATDTNEACYGYVLVDAEVRTAGAQFQTPGDILELFNFESVQLSPLDVQAGLWGLMVMYVEANLGTEAQVLDDVQIVLFGDTVLEDASSFVQIIAESDVPVHRQPDSTTPVRQTLNAGQSIIANGRLDGDGWLRVRLTGEENGIGWVRSDQVTPQTPLDTLPVIEADATDAVDLSTLFGPLQAFYFRSGEEETPCAEAPQSGMLIQTPDGQASVSIWLDEVVVQLNGTSVIDAQADGTLTVSVVEGSAQVEANGETRTATEGQAIDVELDEELAAVSVPSEPRPLDPDDVRSVPVVLLDDPVSIPAPASSNAPRSGEWRFRLGVEPPITCPDGTAIPFLSTGIPAQITVQLDSITISGVRFDETTEGIYEANYFDASGNLYQDTLQLIASDRIVGEREIDLADRVCTITVPISFQLIQPD